jgi:hypothetical protein
MEALARIAARVAAGVEPREAYVAEFGVEAWEAFVGELYEALRAKAPAEPEEPVLVAAAVPHVGFRIPRRPA